MLIWQFITGYFFDNSGSYDSLLQDIFSITHNSGSYDSVITGYFLSTTGSYDSLLKDISS